MTKLMLDLCSGTKSASAAFRDAGWEILTVDNDPDLEPDEVRDVREFAKLSILTALVGVPFIWASPPCTEFARESMPWSRTGNEPDMSIVLACIDIIKTINPTYWCIENVRGAVRYFEPLIGRPREIIGPYFLWGNFPPLPRIDMRGWRKKESRSSSQDKERGAIPYSLSASMLLAITLQERLL